MAITIKNRTVAGNYSVDPSSIDLLTYNEKAGAKKVTPAGPLLLPLGAGTPGVGGFTTDASTPKILNSAGLSLAIYNSDTRVHAVTVGDATMTPQAPGAVQSGATPFVGVPCGPGAWTYVGAGQWNWVATNSSTLMVFVIDDHTLIITQPQNNAST